MFKAHLLFILLLANVDSVDNICSTIQSLNNIWTDALNLFYLYVIY